MTNPTQETIETLVSNLNEELADREERILQLKEHIAGLKKENENNMNDYSAQANYEYIKELQERVKQLESAFDYATDRALNAERKVRELQKQLADLAVKGIERELESK